MQQRIPWSITSFIQTQMHSNQKIRKNKMKKYNIVDEKGQFWSRTESFGYWSKFSSDSDKKCRCEFLYLFAKIMVFWMKREGIKAKLEEV